jgi:DNA polymerase-3 subunit epsilon
MQYPAETLVNRKELNITLVDIETTGLNFATDEVIGVGLLCLRVQTRTGRVQGVVGSSFQWREPGSMSPKAEAVVGITQAELKGRRFDQRDIERVLSMTDLVVAHNAAFDRPFLERWFPALVDLPWACSLTDIRWRSQEGLEQASLDFLLSRYGAAPSSGRPEADCHALAYVVAQPLPRSPCTGFRRLIEAADAVSVECVLADDSTCASPAAEVLVDLGFYNRGKRLRADCPSSAAAERLEMAVIDRAVANPAFASLKMWRVDARNRFTRRARPIAAR